MCHSCHSKAGSLSPWLGITYTWEVFGNKSGKPHLDARSWRKGLTDGGSGTLDPKPSSVQFHGMKERCREGSAGTHRTFLDLTAIAATPKGDPVVTDRVCGHRQFQLPCPLPGPSSLAGAALCALISILFYFFPNLLFTRNS